MNPIDLFASALAFHPDGAVRARERSMTSDDGGWQLAAFRVQTDADVHADHWEMHPAAEEAVCCLSGGLRIYFRPAEPGGEEEMARLAPGTAVIVPRGRWHRLELDGPSEIVSIGLRGGTRQERRGAAF